MSETKGSLRNYSRLVLLVIVIAAIVHIFAGNVSKFTNVAIALFGLGVVALVHEFGHFIFAKLAGIKVENFTIFLPPVLLGVRRTEAGFRFRILPKFFPRDEDPDGDGQLSFTLGGKAARGETEYRVGLVPFAGYVKMLGQEDTGPAKTTEDPRAYCNKSVSARMAVVSAGVVFNTILAALIFMTVFLVGVEFPPPVVGGVLGNSPAARAGLQAGDEIIEVDGKTDIDFSSIMIAAALSDANELVGFRVRRRDGSVENLAIIAQLPPGASMRAFGIERPMTLTIAPVADPCALLKETGFLPGDVVTAVNGKSVSAAWQLDEKIGSLLTRTATLTVNRIEATSGRAGKHQVTIPLELLHVNYNFRTGYDLGHIYSIVPRLRVTGIRSPAASRLGRLAKKIGVGVEEPDSAGGLQSGDIITAVGDLSNPTFTELREVVTEYENKPLAVTVLRSTLNGDEESVTVTVVPRRSPGSDRVLIGIAIVLDAEHPIVAETIADENSPCPLAIPRGAAVTAVDGVKVSNFYEIIGIIRRNKGKRITVDWRIDNNNAGDVVLDIPAGQDNITVKSAFARYIPFENLKRTYKAAGPADAVVIGCKRTGMFIAQTYITIRGLLLGLISPKNLMGPVGIIAWGSRIVKEQPFTYFLYFQGLLSACLAVMNFLPLPVLDGGHVVLLLIEKIKGSALSQRTQSAVAYVGLALIIALVLYITFNDIVKFFLSD